MYSVEVLVNEEAWSNVLVWVPEADKHKNGFRNVVARRVVDRTGRQVAIYDDKAVANDVCNHLNWLIAHEDHEAFYGQLMVA